MNKHFLFLSFLVAVGTTPAMLLHDCRAETTDETLSNVEREIFVPYSDLHVILEGDPQRVFMTREEYDTLAKKARSMHKPEAEKQPAAVLSAAYVADIDERRANISATLVVTAPDENIHAVELDLSGAGLKSASLDGKPAVMGRSEKGVPVLFVSGSGQHTLLLEIEVPIDTTAAQRSLSFQLPTPPAAKLLLSVPGNVEIKSGATIVRREFDEAKSSTRFELLPRRGQNTLLLSLNNRQLQKDRVVVAHAVLIDEISAAAENLDATMSFSVLHGATDQFEISMPSGFEVLSAEAPEIARWSVAEKDGQNILTVSLHEPTSSTVTFHISASRTPAPLKGWILPRLVAKDVAGQTTVIGLVVDSRLKPRDLQPTQLIPIDAIAIAKLLPDRVAGPDKISAKNLIAAYYAPQQDFALSGTFVEPQAELLATSGLFLSLSDKELQLRGSFSLTNRTEKLLGFDFLIPATWQVSEVTAADNTPLRFETYPHDDTRTRIHVPLTNAVDVGHTSIAYFRAIYVPEGWLDDWQSKSLEFPEIQVQGAVTEVGAIAVHASEEIEAHAQKAENLTPLDANEKARYGLSDVPTELAYRYSTPQYALKYVASKTRPRLTAKTFSFFRIEPALLSVHTEIHYHVTDTRESKFEFTLPASTPAELAIQALDGLQIKEFNSHAEGDLRHWTAQLSEPKRGTVRLAIDFQMPLEENPAGVALVTPPLGQALGVSYQMGTIAVEGSAEQRVQIDSQLRKVDVGELAEAEYQPGRRLLGAYGYGGNDAKLNLSVTRSKVYELPSVLIERAELITDVSTGGQSQTAARFDLRAKAQMIELRLPEGSALWSVHLDGQPLLPQRSGLSLLVDLPATATAVRRSLQVVYETPVAPIGLLNGLTLPAPQLFVRAEAGGTADEIPLADLDWHVGIPSGYRIARSSGTVVQENPSDKRSPSRYVLARILDTLSTPFAVQYAVETASRRTPSFLPAEERFLDDNLSSDEAQVFNDAHRSDAASSLDRELINRHDADRESGSARRLRFAAPTSNYSQTSPAPHQPRVPQKADKLYLTDTWAFEGLRSLPIEMQSDSARTSFASLGASPELTLTIVNYRRLEFLAWGIGLIVLSVGLLKTDAPLSKQLRFVVLLASVSLALPWLLPSFQPVAVVCDWMLLAAMLLLAYFFAVFALKGMLRLARTLAAIRPRLNKTSAAALLLAVGSALQASAEGAPPKPVQVPKDAIIVPYDATTEDPLLLLDLLTGNEENRPATLPAFGNQKSRKILVPYEKFLALRKVAQLEKVVIKPPAAYAWAGATYSTTLHGEDSLTVEGKLNIQLYAEGPLSVPLDLQGAVLTKITVDGEDKTAGISLDAPIMPANELPAQRQAAAMPTPPASPPLSLVLTGPGRHSVNFSVRLPLERRGGWQVANGRLPVTAAAALEFKISQANTEVILSTGGRNQTFESTTDGQTFDTALAAEGQLRIQWRAKASRAPVDQSLVVKTFATFDVQEDALRLACRFDLAFRRDQRDSFTVEVPDDYSVAQVTGPNIRGWTAQTEGAENQLEVTLLKPAQERESFVIELARRGKVGEGALARFQAPLARIVGAAQESGEITIRRSPFIELRTQHVTGASRINQPSEAHFVGELEHPLGILAYQTYEFPTSAFSAELTAKPISAQVVVEVQTVLKVSEHQRDLESRLRLRVQDRPVFRLKVLLPEDWKPEHVIAPEPFQWIVSKAAGQTVLDVFLVRGAQGSFDLILSGPLGEYDTADSTSVPPLKLIESETNTKIISQTGQIVVQADPGLQVGVDKLEGCETELLSRTQEWLSPEQRSLARLAIKYRSPDYTATLQLSRRAPAITCQMVSNVRVTRRTIEETILLDFQIRDAGIREVAFLLPASLKDARISAPLVRQKTVEKVADNGDSQVRVRLALQDEVMNDFRVLVENDRLLTAESFTAPIAVIETGETLARYITLESAGRDEVLVENKTGVDPLEQEQSQWRMLVGLLGRGLTQAYLIRSGTEQPQLTLRSKDRETVETAGARIGLAKTTLVVDANGAFRAIQLYRVDNSLEQYLDVIIPDKARLWTAHVAGEAVKPVATANKNEVRVPLVKTAVGDADYAVVLKYGGELGSLKTVDSVDFPFIHTLNINVELSHVELYLPPSYRWMNFGGTMRVASSEADLAAGLLAYNTKQIGLALEALRSEDSYTRARAVNNLKSLEVESQVLQEHSLSLDREESKELQKQIQSNTASLSQFGVEIQRQQAEISKREAVIDNRGRLNSYFDSQSNGRASEVLDSAGRNFTTSPLPSIVSEKTNAEAASRIAVDQIQKKESGDIQYNRIAGPTVNNPFGDDNKAAPQSKADFSNLAKDAQIGKSRKQFGGRSYDYDNERSEDRYAKQLELQQGAQTSQRGIIANQQQESMLEDRLNTIPSGSITPPPPGAWQRPGSGRLPLAAQQPQSQSKPQPQESPTALASLDVEIQPQGIKYLLTTPRGEVKITAQAVSGLLITRLLKVIAIGVFLGVSLFILDRVARRSRRKAELAT